MTDDDGDPCPEHPAAARIGGMCAACVIRRRIGSFSVEALPYPYETGCRSTIHCANFGFCHRCSPELARASSFALQALKEVGREWDGGLYGKVMETIRDGMGDMSESSRGL
jgi:hypothetical protein